MSSLGERLAVAALHSFDPRAALLAPLQRAIGSLRRRHELWRSRKQLANLDERLLRDIGLDRSIARREASIGFWD